MTDKTQIDASQLRRHMAGATTRAALWTNILHDAGSKTVAEFGVWRGNFARRILETCPFIERYYMVDPWAQLPDWNRAKNFQTENFEEIFQEALSNTAFAAPKLSVLRGRTKDVIHHIPDQSLDFAYIDGDHTLRGVTIDLIKVLPKMKPGGIIGGDDFLPKPWPQSPKFEPTMVCPYSIYFAEATDLPIFCLPYDNFLIQVLPDQGFSLTDLTGNYGDISLTRSPDDPKPNKRQNALRRARRQARRAAAPA